MTYEVGAEEAPVVAIEEKSLTTSEALSVTAAAKQSAY